ncbi:MAG: FAD binding domain-containing protein [Candidatus Eremiobacteraeota bacterium]|nr:FAD binding domain-containing protein [Candidatus Eremiobacteraeota bacterium]
MEYFEPHFLDEALVLLDRFGSGARVLAGGTRLGLELRRPSVDIHALVNIKRIGELHAIGESPSALRIGALVTAATLAQDLRVISGAPLLARAAATLGARQLRNVATLGGNLCSGHPAADLSVALVACGARCRLAGLSDDVREISAEEFVRAGPQTLRAGELLVGVAISKADACVSYQKMQTRRAFEMAIVAVGVQCVFEERAVADVRIALGGAAPTIVRASVAEAAVSGGAIEDASARRAARIAAEDDASPRTDRWASADYRRHLVGVLTERALLDVAAQSRRG